MSSRPDHVLVFGKTVIIILGAISLRLQWTQSYLGRDVPNFSNN